MTVEISIIIPVYNCEKYLDTCIISVLMQTYPNFEVICVDDKSTDNSLCILKRYANIDKRIKLIVNDENKGPGYSRNKALNLAKGKYVFFLDSDDWIDNKTLEFLYKECEKNNLDMIMFKYIAYYDDGSYFGHETYYDMKFMDKYEGAIFKHWDLKANEVFSLIIGPCNKMYNKSFLYKHDIKFPNENLIQEDNIFFFKVITLAERISFFNKYFYNRRRRKKSIMSSLNDERLFSRIYIAELTIEYFLIDYYLFNHYKKNLFNYISKHLTNDAYELIENELKEEMYSSIQNLYLKFFNEYDLKEDILECVEKNLLIKFGLIDV